MTQAALICSFVKMQTMADGTPRLTIDLPGTSLQELATMNLVPGAPLALARLTDEAAQQHQRTTMIASAEQDKAPPAPAASRHGDYYVRLHRLGFFWNPRVLAALGTDQQYNDWVRLQPSCVSGGQDWDHTSGRGYCDPAHVRRVANGAGTAEKPPFSTVPLTHAEHALQHQHGEGYYGGKTFFDQQRAKYVTLWAKQRLYDLLGVTSLADVEPARFEALCAELGIYEQIPRGKQ